MKIAAVLMVLACMGSYAHGKDLQPVSKHTKTMIYALYLALAIMAGVFVP